MISAWSSPLISIATTIAKYQTLCCVVVGYIIWVYNMLVIMRILCSNFMMNSRVSLSHGHYFPNYFKAPHFIMGCSRHFTDDVSKIFNRRFWYFNLNFLKFVNNGLIHNHKLRAFLRRGDKSLPGPMLMEFYVTTLCVLFVMVLCFRIGSINSPGRQCSINCTLYQGNVRKYLKPR